MTTTRKPVVSILKMATLKDSEALEQMIDSIGLVRIVEALGQICLLKAEHLAENWQETDTDQAKTWKHNATYLDKVSTHVWRQAWERVS